MPYLGNTPAEAYTSFDKQTITGNGGTSYTLDHAVGNEQEIEVFVNNVRQEPSVAYTVSGTALTMTGDVAASDDFYVVFQGKAIQTTAHPEGQDLKARDGTFGGDVTADGSVGIGTTSPAFPITSDFDAPATWGNASGNFAQMWQNSGTNALGVAIGDDNIASLTTNNGYELVFATSGVERVRVTANGLSFNGDTAAANSLNDYEEGTWTPVFADATSGGNASPTTAVSAKYTKVGSLVHVNFRMDNIDRTGLTSSNNAYVRGLPYQPNAEAIGTLWSQSMNTHSTTIYCVSRVFSGNSYIRFENVRDNTSDYTQTVGDFGDDSADITVTLTYTTDE